MDENPYKSPVGPLEKPQKAPHNAATDWSAAALVLLVIYACAMAWMMWWGIHEVASWER
jgi:hypothetical protein